MSEPTWPGEVHKIFQRWKVTQIGYVPDNAQAHSIRLALADPGVHAVLMTSEQEGIGMLVGAHLGGARGVMLMQSSGVGNCVNAFSLVRCAHVPMLLVITMRGDFGETNPWQFPMARITRPVLELSGFMTILVERPEEVADAVEAACKMAYQGGQAVAVLLSQRVLGAKVIPQRAG